MNSKNWLCLFVLVSVGTLCSASFTIGGRIEGELLDNLRKAALARINQLRADHHAPAVKLTDELNNIAQAHSDNMVKTGKFSHSSFPGENIYMMGSGPAPIQYNLGAVNSWYSEVADYDFTTGNSKNGKDIGHFTAMVWDEVKEIGLGYQAVLKPYSATMDIAYVYVTLNLSPTPNMQGTYTDHVHAK